MSAYKVLLLIDDNWPCVYCFTKAVELFPRFVNQQNKLGNTPLHTLSQSVRFPLSRAEILAIHGANFDLLNSEGKTAKQVAKTATTSDDLDQAQMNAKKNAQNSNNDSRGCNVS